MLPKRIPSYMAYMLDVTNFADGFSFPLPTLIFIYTTQSTTCIKTSADL